MAKLRLTPKHNIDEAERKYIANCMWSATPGLGVTHSEYDDIIDGVLDKLSSLGYTVSPLEQVGWLDPTGHLRHASHMAPLPTWKPVYAKEEVNDDPA